MLTPFKVVQAEMRSGGTYSPSAHEDDCKDPDIKQLLMAPLCEISDPTSLNIVPQLEAGGYCEDDLKDCLSPCKVQGTNLASDSQSPNVTADSPLLCRPLTLLRFDDKESSPANYSSPSLPSFSMRSRQFSYKRQTGGSADGKTPLHCRKRKAIDCAALDDQPSLPVVALTRCLSDSASLERALSRQHLHHDLIADYSKPFCLPLMPGRNPDLASISAMTLCELIDQKYSEVVSRFEIFDCRYPYEFDGGHILGARNVYTQDQISQELEQFRHTPHTDASGRRLIVIFHCEFSSERAPNLSRFCRKMDRRNNKDRYPHLDMPEMYMLNGGYRQFYQQGMNRCVPQSYKPMLHQDHSEDLRHFRSKSKSWPADKKKHNVRYKVSSPLP